MNKLNIKAEPNMQDMELTRIFPKPRDVVYKAYMNPELIPEWWGPRRYETIVDEMDVRPGGYWRFINRDAEGNEFGPWRLSRNNAGARRLHIRV